MLFYICNLFRLTHTYIYTFLVDVLKQTEKNNSYIHIFKNNKDERLLQFSKKKTKTN